MAAEKSASGLLQSLRVPYYPRLIVTKPLPYSLIESDLCDAPTGYQGVLETKKTPSIGDDWPIGSETVAAFGRHHSLDSNEATVQIPSDEEAKLDSLEIRASVDRFSLIDIRPG